MSLIVLKLISGEEIIGSLEGETAKFRTISNPVLIGLRQVPNPDGSRSLQIAFGPWPAFAEPKDKAKYNIDAKSVAYHYTPSQDVQDKYTEIFSGIVLPQKQLITG